MGFVVVGRDVHHVFGLHRHQVGVVVAGPLAEPGHGEPAAVGGERPGRAPPAGGEDHALPAGPQVTDPHVEVDAGAAVGRVGQAAAVTADAAGPGDVPQVGDDRTQVAAVGGQPVDLEAFVTAVVEGQQHVVAVGQVTAPDRLGQVGQLAQRTAGAGHVVELHGPAQVGAHEHPLAGRGEAGWPGGADLQVVADRGSHDPTVGTLLLAPATIRRRPLHGAAPAFVRCSAWRLGRLAPGDNPPAPVARSSTTCAWRLRSVVP